MVRKAIESLYKGRCTIINSENVFDFVTKITSQEDVVVCENEPCRLSHLSSPNASQSDTVSNVTQIIKLFIRPELRIPAGSKIEVTQNGVTKKYISSGESAIYTNHQEIVLEMEDDKA